MIPLRDQDYIRDRFAQDLTGRVKIDYFTQQASTLFIPGREECAKCEDTRQLLEELAALSENVSLTIHDLAAEAEQAQKLGVDKVPGIVIRGPANRPLRFFGMPTGNEFPNFIEAMIEVSKTKVELGVENAKALKKLKDNVSITVYVTPTCPHCPGVVRAAYRLALASSHISATAVEIGEFPRLAERLGLRAVPFTVFNEQQAVAGAMDEAALITQALKSAEGSSLGAQVASGGETTDTSQPNDPPPPPPRSGLILPP